MSFYGFGVIPSINNIVRRKGNYLINSLLPISLAVWWGSEDTM
jgi:hypothetical protein